MNQKGILHPASLFTGKKISTLFVGLFFLIAIPAAANVYNVNTTNDTHATDASNGTGLDDNGQVSLRSALETIDAIGGGPHTINLPAGIYLLTEGEIYFGNQAQTIIIQGAGAASTVIEMATGANQDRIFFINLFGDVANVSVTINDVKFKNGHLNSDPFGGGAIRAGGPNNLLSVHNSVFENNTIDATNAGTTGGAINMSGGGSLIIQNSTFIGNTNPASDGGAVYYFLQNFPGLTGSVLITNSTFAGNSTPAPFNGNGGAIGFAGAGATPGQSFSVTIQENTFINNSAPGAAGGAIAANTSFGPTGLVAINYNRFVNNAALFPGTSGMVLITGNGNVNATNNWWGCNTGPSAAGTCDKALAFGFGSGVLTTSPWLQLKASAPPIFQCPGDHGTTTVTASFLSNSSNLPVLPTNLDAIIGLPISFVNPVLGTLSAADPVIQATGTAKVTFTSNGTLGVASVNAVVDNVPANDPTAKATFNVSGDNTGPVMVCPAPVTVQCASMVPPPNPASVTATDNNTPNPTVTWEGDVISNQTCANRYIVTRTYKATDDCGNSSTCTQIITVNDNTAPAITCPVAVTVQCSSAVPPHDFAGGTSSDNCGGAPTVVWVSDAVSNQSCVNKYTITRTYKATDECGNSSTCTQTITVDDNIAPVMSCPPAVTVQCASQVPASDFANGTATDNCGNPTVTWLNDVISNQSCANRYTITRTYQASDGCNTTTCTQIITVNDDIAPTMTAGSIGTCYASAAAAEAAALANTSVSDNCSGIVTKTAITTGDCNATVIVTATDVCGNSATVSYSTRIDNTPPVVSAGSIASCYQTAAAAAAAAVAATTATDNCPGNLTTTSAVSGTCSAIVKVTVSDACGNNASVTYQTRIDNTPPTVIGGSIASCYATTADAESAALNATTATDNCPGTVTKTATTTGTCSATVTVTATDGCGNSASVTYNTRIDNTPPALNCENIEVNPTSLAGAVVNYATPTANDNCGNAIVSYVSGGTSGSTFPIGVTTITYKATDECGNTSTCTFTITVRNPACGQNGNRVLVCHNGHTICISPNSLQNHLSHGDQLGSCSWYQANRGITSADELPEGYKLSNFPNPFRQSTIIRFELPQTSNVNIIVYDMMGKQISTVFTGERKAGLYNEEFVASNLPAGMYYYKFTATSNGMQVTKTEKLVIIK